MEEALMSLLFIAATLFASIPAVFIGVNNGFTFLCVLVMCFSGYKVVTSR